MIAVVDNYPIQPLKPLLSLVRPSPTTLSWKAETELYNKVLLTNRDKIMDVIRQDIYYRGTVIEDMERLSTLDKSGDEYRELYQKIIAVGEYTINHSSTQ
jgi:hypothetical protein